MSNTSVPPSREQFEMLMMRVGKHAARSVMMPDCYMLPSVQGMWVAYQLGAGMLTLEAAYVEAMR